MHSGLLAEKRPDAFPVKLKLCSTLWSGDVVYAGVEGVVLVFSGRSLLPWVSGTPALVKKHLLSTERWGLV